MRLKLVVIVSLIASILGAGGTLAIAFGLLGGDAARRFASPDIFILPALLLPILTTVFAAIFVYRHTARRRKLQALATVLLTIILTLTILLVSPMFFSRTDPEPPVAPPNIG